MKPSQDNPQGGIVEKEMSIHLSNLMLLEKSKAVKVGLKFQKMVKKLELIEKIIILLNNYGRTKIYTKT